MDFATENLKAMELLANVAEQRECIANQMLWKYANEQLDKGNGRVINVDGSPYLTRIYLDRGKPESGMFLHHFHKGDQGRDVHNHPWKSSYSIVLTGGYIEERCEIPPNTDPMDSLKNIVRLEHKPGDINWLTCNTYHRVDLMDPMGAWTLFMRRERIQGWNFLSRYSGVKTIMDSDPSTQD